VLQTDVISKSRKIILKFLIILKITSLQQMLASFLSPPKFPKDFSISIEFWLRAGQPWFYSRQGLGFSLPATASIPTLGSTQPVIQWVYQVLSLGIKQPERESDHSFPSSAAVKNSWSYTSSPPVRLHGAVLN